VVQVAAIYAAASLERDENPMFDHYCKLEQYLFAVN